MAKKIVDMYHGDAIKTYNSVKEECEFILHKISQGTKMDSKFLTRAKEFEKKDIPFWGYIFLNKGDEISQIDYAWRNIQQTVKNYKNFIGIVIDVEANNTANDSLKAIKYLRSLAYSNHLKFGFYCGNDNLTKYKDAVNYVKGQSRGFLWVARYTNKYTVPDYVDLWQYTETGKVNCLANDDVDLNKINTTEKHKLDWYKKKVNSKKSYPLPSDIIKNAKNHVGYIEKESNKKLYCFTGNKGDNNYTKFGEWIGCNGDYWCASFQSWLFYRTFGYDQGKEVLGTYSPACEVLRANMKVDKNPKIGDIVFFSGTRHSGANHVGLVYNIDADKIYTIEGNANATGGVTDNGGSVVKKSYSRAYNKIIGYGHPKYAEYYSGKLPSEYPSKGYYFNGCGKSDNVKDIQKFLVWYFGSTCEINPNGTYKDLTEGYVKKFQKDMGIPINGKWGKRCLAKALRCVKYKGKVYCVE